MKLAVIVLLCATAFGQVSFTRILNADKEPGNWLTYSRDNMGHRFSPLAEITTANVGNLKVKWVYQFPDSGNEVSPIVVDNIMYVTGPNSATALDTNIAGTADKKGMAHDQETKEAANQRSVLSDGIQSSGSR